jgi:hypothetical protein
LQWNSSVQEGRYLPSHFQVELSNGHRDHFPLFLYQGTAGQNVQWEFLSYSTSMDLLVVLDLGVYNTVPIYTANSGNS